MKRFFFLPATALLLLLGACSQENVQLPRTDLNSTLMSFSTADANWVASSMTRSPSSIGQNTLSVYGYYTAGKKWSEVLSPFPTPNLFDRQKIENTGLAWTYSPAKSWERTGYHHFFAFAPYGAALSISQVNGTPSILFQVPEQAQKQINLMWALEDAAAVSTSGRSSLLNQTLDENKSSGVVQPLAFSFRHALTRIAFAANVGASVEENRYSISSISLQKLGFEATSKFEISQPIAGVDAITAAKWELSVGADKQRNFFAEKEGKGLISELKLTHTAQPITTTTALAAPNNYDGHMYLIPQPIENSTQTDKPTISVIVHDHSLNTDVVVIGTLVSPSSLGWKANQAITYTITYNGGGNDPLSLLAKVTDWTEQSVPITIGGTFLNLSQTSTKTIDEGASHNVYYSTDYSGTVTASLNGTMLTNHNGYFTIEADAFPSGGDFTLKVNAGNLTRTLPIRITPMTIPTETPWGFYIGAFWRASQTGERIVRIQTPSGMEGEWSARVVWTDNQWGSDRVNFSTDATTDPEVDFDNEKNAADMNLPANDARYNVSSGAPSVGGTTVADGYIYFRMGITAPHLGTKPRYAMVLLRYNGLTKKHILYLRQGEQADRVSSNSNVEWLPYNVGNYAMPMQYGYNYLTAYPSQAGYYKHWSTETMMWPSSTENPVKGWYLPTSTSSIASVCPPGYKIPSYTGGFENTETQINRGEANEMGSLFNGTNTNMNGNLIWGAYADGFFDRHSTISSYGKVIKRNAPISACLGNIIVDRATNKSLFIPAAGSYSNGQLSFDGDDLKIFSTTPSSDDGLCLGVSIQRCWYNYSVLYRYEAIPIRCIRQ